MKDLVERLRGNFPKKEDCKEAADEIVRLRNLLDECGVSHKTVKERQPFNIKEGARAYQLLTAFYENKNLTSDEAGEYVEIPEGDYGWWSDVSKLKKNGYITKLPFQRKSKKGRNVEVYEISRKGKDAVEELGYGK
jgi:hypothetical protein